MGRRVRAYASRAKKTLPVTQSLHSWQDLAHPNQIKIESLLETFWIYSSAI